MQKANKKRKKVKQEYNNPFEDIFFWLTLVTTDFYFGLFEESKEKIHENEVGAL